MVYRYNYKVEDPIPFENLPQIFISKNIREKCRNSDSERKKFENQIALQSRTVIAYLEKIQKLEDHIRSFDARHEEPSINDSRSNTKNSMLNRIFKNNK